MGKSRFEDPPPMERQQRALSSDDSLHGASSDVEFSMHGGSTIAGGSLKDPSVLDRIRTGDCRIPGFEARKPWEKEDVGSNVDSLNRCLTAWPFRIRGDVSPHMRSFHLQWLGMFVSFLGWFAIPPLLPVITAGDVPLTRTEMVVSNCVAVSGPILSRALVGVVSDRWGPRIAQTVVLATGAVTVGLSAFATSVAGLTAARFFVSFLGGALVPCQHHVSVLFAPPVVGSALAIAAGWGNLGGGAAQLLMPAVYEAILDSGVDPDRAWRAALALPAGLAALLAALVFAFAKDLPAGNWAAMRARGLLPRASPLAAFSVAARDYRCWVLAAVYGACFGVELIVYNFSVVFYTESFGLSLQRAGLCAGLFGAMNLFSRPLGGVISDRLAARWGIQARVQVLFAFLALEAAFLVVYSRVRDLAASLVFLAAFSVFAQAAAGATFALVAFLTRRAAGSAAGIVAAGGNVGAFFGGFLFALAGSWENAFLLLGACVALAAPLCAALRFNGLSIFVRPGRRPEEPRAGRSTRNGSVFQSVCLPPESGAYLIREVVRSLNAASEHPIVVQDYLAAVGAPKRTGTEFVVRARVTYGGAGRAVLEARFFQHFDFETFDLLAARIRLSPAIPGGRRRYCLANLDPSAGPSTSTSSRGSGTSGSSASVDVVGIGADDPAALFPRRTCRSSSDVDSAADNEDSINSRKGLLLQARRAAMGARASQSTLAAALSDPTSALSRCLASAAGASLLHTPRQRPAIDEEEAAEGEGEERAVPSPPAGASLRGGTIAIELRALAAAEREQAAAASEAPAGAPGGSGRGGVVWPRAEGGEHPPLDV